MKNQNLWTKELMICGHRGKVAGGHENTIAAFREAIADGVDFVETDVHMTKDGQIVLQHDSFLEGVGEICDYTLKELQAVKPDLPLLRELEDLLTDKPQVGLLLELKDLPPDNSDGVVTHPAPYSGSIFACSGLRKGHETLGEDMTPACLKSGDKKVEGSDIGIHAGMTESFSYECAEKALNLLKEAGLNKRTWVLSFSGKLLEEVYRRYGREFHYHAFYPWFIMGDMQMDPASFCEMACMQHRYLDEEGRIIRYEDPMCPASWWKEVLDFGMIPIGAPSLASDENYREAVRRGCRLINANDPKAVTRLFQ